MMKSGQCLVSKLLKYIRLLRHIQVHFFSFSSCFTKVNKENGMAHKSHTLQKRNLAPVQVNNSCMIMKMENLPTFIRFTHNILGVEYFDQVNQKEL